MSKINNIPLASSLGTYFLIMTILTAFESGIVFSFWIYLFATMVSGGLGGYKILKETNTVAPFAIDGLTLGLLLITYFFDKVKLDNTETGSVIAFSIGLLLVVRYLIKYFKKS